MYVKQTWEDGVELTPPHVVIEEETYNVVPATIDGGTSITAQKLNHMEDGIYDSYTYTNTAIQNAITTVLESEY